MALQLANENLIKKRAGYVREEQKQILIGEFEMIRDIILMDVMIEYL